MVMSYLTDHGHCTCAVAEMYKREWRIKTGRIDVYVPAALRCTVHYGVLPSEQEIEGNDQS
jgi:hypothetical protein